ncbi:MAG: hypothetical protein Q9164_007622, partial [Protoblastenia rupestris]
GTVATPASLAGDLSFLFKIEPLHPDFSLEQPQTNCHGCWDPPNTSAEYTREPGSLYSWRGGQAYAVPAGDNDRQVSGLEAFGAATVFTQWPKDVHLLAVNYDVKQTLRTSRIHWRTLSFDHHHNGPTNHYLPYVNPEALHFHLPAPDTDRWVSQLLPCCYVSPQNQDADGRRIEPTTFNDGLVGKLPVLIALAVFSAPKDQMNQVLTNCLQPNHWRPHNF